MADRKFLSQPEPALNAVGEKISDDREQMLDFKTFEDLAKVAKPGPDQLILAKVDDLFRWAQLSSLWPMTFGLASRR